tara:strand:+ start:823 stop:951 length:129 start_codon:yes stop_codon:yes gene_type:complete
MRSFVRFLANDIKRIDWQDVVIAISTLLLVLLWIVGVVLQWW